MRSIAARTRDRIAEGWTRSQMREEGRRLTKETKKNKTWRAMQGRSIARLHVLGQFMAGKAKTVDGNQRGSIE